MKTVSSDYAQQNFTMILTELATQSTPIRVRQKGGVSVVMIEEKDFEGLIETAYLLSSPANATSLEQAMEEFNSGQGVKLDAEAIMDAYGTK